MFGRELNLNNQLSGELPDTVPLPSITILHLYVNSIEGTIPTIWNAPTCNNLLVLFLAKVVWEVNFQIEMLHLISFT